MLFKPNRGKGEILSWPAFGAVIIWGFSFIATKVALKEVHPFTLLTLRFGIGAFLLLLFQLIRDKGFFKVFSRRDWISILLLAAAGIAGHNLLQAFGLLYTTAINTGWIIAIQPIFIIPRRCESIIFFALAGLGGICKRLG